MLREEDRLRRRQERKEADRNTVLLESQQNGRDGAEGKKTKSSQPQFYQIRAGEEFRSFNDMAHKQKLQKYVLLCFYSIFMAKVLPWTCELILSGLGLCSCLQRDQLDGSRSDQTMLAGCLWQIKRSKSICANNGRKVLKCAPPTPLCPAPSSPCRASLEERLKLEEFSGTSSVADSAVGSKQLTFTLQKVKRSPCVVG